MQDLVGARHGYLHLGIDERSVARGSVSSSVAGPGVFWSLFDLPPLQLDDDQLKGVASEMDWEDQPADPSSDSMIPAGYTVLGQFITHDLTFDTRPLSGPSLGQTRAGGRRTPQLDLDSVYEQSPRLAYVPPRVLLAPGAYSARMLYWGSEDGAEPPDVPRFVDLQEKFEHAVYPDDKAIVGDVRNDDNILLSQLHLAFLKLHNQFVGYVRRDVFGNRPVSEQQVFDEARRLCEWHYQTVIVNDYLPRIVGQETVDLILAEPHPDDPRRGLKLYVGPNTDPPTIPVEFSAAAFRFGHSMIRSHYRVNEAGIEYPLFSYSAQDGRHLGGSRRLPAALRIDWTRFFDDLPLPKEFRHDPNVQAQGEPREFARNFARKIDSHLTQILEKVPADLLPPDDRLATRSLALRDLERGMKVGLSSGRAVAEEVQRRIGGDFPVYSNEELGLGRMRLREGDVPLWYYVLKEAELREQGEKLGPVGGRIVAEVILGMLMRDETSCLRDKEFRLVIEPRSRERGLTMADLLRFARVTRRDA